MERFNESIELLIRKRGIAKKQLIEYLGISRSAFYSKLAGVRPWFLDEAVSVAEFFGVRLDEMLG